MVGIYRIQNNINGKVYIGQSTDIKKRWKSHKRDLQKGEHPNPHLQKAWNLYGEKAFSFDVLEKCRSYKLNELEPFWISSYLYIVAPAVSLSLNPRLLKHGVQIAASANLT